MKVKNYIIVRVVINLLAPKTWSISPIYTREIHKMDKDNENYGSNVFAVTLMSYFPSTLLVDWLVGTTTRGIAPLFRRVRDQTCII